MIFPAAESLILLFACFGGGFGLQHKVGPHLRRLFRVTPESKGLRGALRELLSCAFCSGFWGGILVWLLSSPLLPEPIGQAIIYGLAAAAFYYALDALVQLAESRLPPMDGDDA